MSRIGNNPLLLGFEDIDRMLDRIGKSSEDGYPPYNIERQRNRGSEDGAINIVMAVAGFTRSQLDITLEDNELTITGQQRAEGPREYLHRGIAARQFRRSFVLADGLVVKSAELHNGLLTIEVIRPEPEKRVKRIEIKNRL